MTTTADARRLLMQAIRSGRGDLMYSSQETYVLAQAIGVLIDTKIAEAAQAPATWPPMRPMSEAPRDGTEILVDLNGDGWNVVEWIGGRWHIGGDCWCDEASMRGWWPLPEVMP